MDIHPERLDVIDQLDREIAETMAAFENCENEGQRETVERWLGFLHNRRPTSWRSQPTSSA